MNYTLITRTGKIYTFYVKAVAETYLSAYGGNLVDTRILAQPVVETVVH